jgi:hypothetical protein
MKFIVPVVLSVVATVIAVVITGLVARRDVRIDLEGLPAAV